MRKTLILALTLSLTACDKAPSKPLSTSPVPNQPVTTQQPQKPVEPTAAVEPEPIVPEKVEIKNLEEAIAIARPSMKDVDDGAINTGAAMLAMWSADAMKWSELQKIPEAKYAMVMKDPDEQRGKRICTRGKIIEIAIDNSVPQKIYMGGFYDKENRIYRFIAVRSTGELVQHSVANFCGVVIGKESYQNSAGGMTHSVNLVGMFDLPENKTL